MPETTLGLRSLYLTLNTTKTTVTSGSRESSSPTLTSRPIPTYAAVAPLFLGTIGPAKDLLSFNNQVLISL